MERFEPILQGKNAGWCLGPSVLVLRVLKVGASDRPPTDFGRFCALLGQILAKLRSSREEVGGWHEDSDMRTK